MEYNWTEIEEKHEENMKSIRESFVSINRSYRMIMGIVIVSLVIEIGMMI